MFFEWRSLLDLSSDLLTLNLCVSLDAEDRMRLEAVEAQEIIFIFEILLQLSEVPKTCTEAKQHQKHGWYEEFKENVLFNIAKIFVYHKMV